MAEYRYPHLEAVQTRSNEPTAWQQELANAIEGVFSKGAHELDAVVAGLNATRVRPANGGDWTPENFVEAMRELGV